MVKNIFITGKPGCGKTTLIKEILKELKIPAQGFFTEEIREKGKRVGFKIKTLNQKEGILAHKDLKSQFRVSKYGVNLKDLEEIGVKELEKGLEKEHLLIVDEIGKMELFSQRFKDIILRSLESKNKVLGTIMIKENPFSKKIKKRSDTKIFYLAPENKKMIKKEILEILNPKTN